MIFITNESELNLNNGISALYFYADWLHFHKKMKVMIDKVEEDKKNIKFYAIDIDSFKNLNIRFNVDSIPTVVILDDNGKELDRIVGMPMTSAFKKVFYDICSAYEASKKKSGEDNGKDK